MQTRDRCFESGTGSRRIQILKLVSILQFAPTSSKNILQLSVESRLEELMDFYISLDLELS